MYQTAAAANKEGKKDPETTKETVAHPFLVLSVINYLANITEILSPESPVFITSSNTAKSLVNKYVKT